MSELIDRQAAVDALWKALYEYEDKTEKQFQESEDLDVGDWIVHRGFVQNMSDIDRRTIINLPSVQPEIIRCKDCKYCEHWDDDLEMPWCHMWAGTCDENAFCSYAERREE